jgi:2-polyprenyl-3-methyl-5-hydroxy-6-metoxy-1,4-benzoquinol methylase
MQQQEWNKYYSNINEPWTTPNSALQTETQHMAPGSALDLGCGEGADCLWLAAQGWQVTAVDFAPAAIATLQRLAIQRGLQIQGVVADIVAYEPAEKFDLVLMCYIHLPRNDRAGMLTCASAALAPGGTLLYIAVVHSGAMRGFDIPDEWLATPDEIVTKLSQLAIEKIEIAPQTIRCPGGSFQAETMTVRASRRGKDIPAS